MTRLGPLQERFQGYLTTGDLAPLRPEIVGDEKADAATRLGIYADAYRLRLLDALRDNYPAVNGLLGDEAFETLVQAYLAEYPSSYRSIRWFGDRLAGFLETTAPWGDQPVLAEMARFEWSLRAAFDAADAEPLPLEAAAQIAPEAWPGMRLAFHPSVDRLDLQWNVPAIWKQFDRGREPDPPQAAEYPIGWVIWRRDLQQYFRSLQVDEAWALDAMRRGRTFAEVCEGLCEWLDPPHVALQAAAYLKGWLKDGLVTGIETN